MSNFESEHQLHQELRTLFELDTQKYLQLYINTVQLLNEVGWKEDIQQIYRCVHTIKGGAVTVGADAILEISNVLEDLLSDLRYLDIAPPLNDGKLQQILVESGELLIGSLQLSNIQAAKPAVQRIQDLHSKIKLEYLPEWNEKSQLYQEFAEQGFDLVALDLDIAIEQLPPTGDVPKQTVEIAQHLISQLQEIGEEIGLGADWQSRLATSQDLIKRPEAEFWIQQWPDYLRSLKNCAKHGGVTAIIPLEPLHVSTAIESPQVSVPTSFVADAPTESIDRELRTLFDLDTQKYLQIYVNTVQSLNTAAWKEDIQQIYRCVHTIKGGAATVGADAILQVSRVLEDLLSELRHLESAPPLDDGKLQQILVESGELLIGSLLCLDSQAAQPAVQRILDLSIQVKQAYLSEWNEQSQLHREFAEQGLEMVALELDIAIEQLPAKGAVPEEIIELAQQLIAQLQEIGEEISLGEDWQSMLASSQDLIKRPEAEFWIQQWPDYLRSLKNCAKHGGVLPKPAVNQPITFPSKPQTANKPTELALLSTADIQVPVPLERLDRSSQHLVETLMAARATQGFYQAVQANLLPLVSLAQDSVQYISHLREVQDDYALLESAKVGKSEPQVERYRQGYIAINRLLETSLRLSELGAETGEAAQRTSESLQRLDANLRSLQHTLEESRLIPFETLSFRARGILRDLTTRNPDKLAQMFVSGEKRELDAGTVRSLEPALLHLIRNAYDHGLEPSVEREKIGKPRQGRLELSLMRRGNAFILDLRDDGCGIDATKIHDIALSKNLPLTDTSTSAKLLSVLCQSGFSSAAAVTDISGRGVGMDVVANQVSTMGGQLSLKTELGIGTTFTLQIPVPHLFVRCMLLQAGDRTFAVPTAEVFTTMLLGDLLWQQSPFDPERLPLYTLTIQEDTGAVPALDLYHYWQPITTARSLLPTSIAVRIKRQDSSEGIWFVADALIGQNDLLVNSLPHPMVSPVGMLGVSLQPDGKLIPVIDSLALIEALLTKSSLDSMTSAMAPQTSQMVTKSEITTSELAARKILIVDDAALMRRRIESSLSAQGYDTLTCSDGLEAWDWLQTHTQPALVITDIEMPGMDGFSLIDHCRQAQMNMPILVISSRLAEEWSKETKRLGATDYLTKGFSTPELLSKVTDLLAKAA